MIMHTREVIGSNLRSICGNHMNFDRPSSPRLADRLWTVLIGALVPSGDTLTIVLSSDIDSSEYKIEYQFPKRFGRRRHIQDGVEHVKIRDAHIATLARKVCFYLTILSFCDFPD